MKSIKAHLQQRKAGGGLLGAELAELTKIATSKKVPQPDDELMAAVTNAVNSSSESSGAVQMRDILHKRLTAKNPHKVWLATVLADKVLKDCADVISPVRSDIFQDLADIAGKPLDRYQENFKDEQRAKMHAFDVLRNSGKQAQSILRHTCKIGRMVSLTPMPEKKSRSRTKKDKDEGSGSGPDSRSNSATNIRNDTAGASSDPDSGKGGKMTWAQVKDAVTTSLGVAGSHTTMVQDLVLNITSGKSAAPDFERQFLAELVEEVLSFRTAFQQLLASMSSFKHEDGGPLIKQSLEAVDEMNNVLELYQEQIVAPNKQEAAGAGSSTIGGAGPSSRPRLSASVSAGRATAATATAAAGARKTSRTRSGPLDSVTNLGDALPRTGSGGREKERKERKHRPADMQRSNSGRGPASAGAPADFLTAAPQQAGQNGGGSGASPQQQQFMPAPGYGQPQGYFMQAPQQMYFPQQQQQQQPQQQSPQGQLPSGFIPMPHQSGPGGQPVLYMPVVGPNGEQGFAPVSFPQGATPMYSSGPMMQQQGGQPFPQSFGGGLQPQQQQYQQQHYQPQQGSPMFTPQESAFQVPALAAAPDASSPDQAPQPAGQTAFASTAVGASTAPAPIPATATPAAKSPAASPTRQQLPLQQVRPRQAPAAAATGNPFEAIGGLGNVLDAPYTPAAAGVGAGAQASTAMPDTLHGGVSDSESEGMPRPLSSSSLQQAPFRRGSTEGREVHHPVGGAIPHSISGGDIFPAEHAAGALASAGLDTFSPASGEQMRAADAAASVTVGPTSKIGDMAEASSEPPAKEAQAAA